MSDAAPRPRYVPALDGIRGIGLIGMLCYHAQAPWAKGSIFTISMFFTMSGFLIASLMLHERDSTGTIDLRAFWVRRFRRLLPGALMTLAFVTVFGAFIADQTQRAHLRGDVVSALFYVANWRFVFNGTAYLDAVSSPSPVLHFWSLSIEEQFYLLFPIIAILLVGTRRGRRARSDAARSRLHMGIGIGALTLLSASLPFIFTMSHDRIYLGADTRAAEILMGVLLAVALAKVPLGSAPEPAWWNKALTYVGPVVLAVMVVSWVVVPKDSPWIYRGGLAAYSVLSAILCAAGAMPGNPVARILGVKPLIKLGRLSYGIYLYHWPIYLWLTPQRFGWKVDPLHPTWEFWALLAIRIGVTLVIATLSYRYVEEPLRVGKPLFGQPLRRLAPLSAAILIVAVFAMTVGVQTGTVSVAAAEQSKLRTDTRDADTSSPLPADLAKKAEDAGGAGAQATTTTSPPLSTSTTWQVVPGGLQPPPVVRPKRKLRLLIVGDSSAVFLAFALNTWNDKAKIFDLNSYGLMGCPIGRGGTEFSTAMEKTFDPMCFDWENIWRDAIAKSKPDVIMVASGYHDATDRRLTPDGPWQRPGEPAYDKFLSSEYDKLVDLLSTANAPILWLDNPPVREGQNLANGEILNDPANDPARMDHLNLLLRQLAARRPNVHVIEYAKFFWTWPGGPFDPKVREDGLHVDYDGREIVGSWLGPVLLDAYWKAVIPR